MRPSALSHASSTLAILLAAGLVGCFAAGCGSATDDGIGSQEEDQTVHPKDKNGLAKATVTVTVPSFFKPSFAVGNTTYTYALDFDGTAVQPGKATTVVLPHNAKKSCLTATLWRPAVYADAVKPPTLENPHPPKVGDPLTVTTARQCLWDVSAGSSLTIDLGIAKLWWTGYPMVRSDVLTLGKFRGGAIWGGGVRLYDEATGVNGTGYEFYAQNDVQLLLVPGDYQYATDDARLPSKPFKVVAGKQTDFDADFDDWMARVNLSYEDTEGFPDATLAPELLCFDADGKNQGHLATSRWTNQLVMLDAKTTSCSIVVAGTLQSFTLSPGQTASIALGRLNVDDVELTDEGGQKVKGSFNVQRWNGTAWSAPLLAKPAGTYAGLDLPKDRYQVTIDYQVATGHKTQVFTVDL